MKAIFLAIKGDKFTAARAATAHNVPFAWDYSADGHAFGWTTPHHESILQTWIAEPPAVPPFPDGTLLWYNVRERP